MKRYYFYTPGPYKTELRRAGIIDFHLDALYAEDVHSMKLNKKIKSFSYFDKVKSNVSTSRAGSYSFRFETGKDLSLGHYAKSEKDLLDAFKGSIRVSERDYLRLRRVAVGLLFRYTDVFNNPAGDESRYLWKNDSYHSFYDIRLVALNYNYNSKDYDQEFIDYLKKSNLQLYDCNVPEEIRIHIAKPSGGHNGKNFKCSTFEIIGNFENRTFIDIPDTIKSFKKRNINYENINKHQYNRVRKICKALMFEYCDIDLTEIKIPQTHNITYFDI